VFCLLTPSSVVSKASFLTRRLHRSLAPLLVSRLAVLLLSASPSRTITNALISDSNPDPQRDGLHLQTENAGDAKNNQETVRDHDVWLCDALLRFLGYDKQLKFLIGTAPSQSRSPRGWAINRHVHSLNQRLTNQDKLYHSIPTLTSCRSGDKLYQSMS